MVMDVCLSKLCLVMLMIMMLLSISNIMLADSAKTEILVITTIKPMHDIIESVIDEGIAVENIVPPGVDPHKYEVPLRELTKYLRRADIVITSGPKHTVTEERIFKLRSEGLVNATVLGFQDYVLHGLRPLKVDNSINYHGFFFSLSGVRAVLLTFMDSLMKINYSKLSVVKAKSMKYLDTLTRIYVYGAKKYGGLRVALYSPILQYVVHDLNISTITIIVPELGVEPSLAKLNHVKDLYRKGEIDCVLLTDADLNHNPKITSFLEESGITYVVINVTGEDPYDVVLGLLTEIPKCTLHTELNIVPQQDLTELTLALAISNIVLLTVLATLIIRITHR